MLKISKIDVWAAPLEDRPGTLLAKLEKLAAAGVNLTDILGHRVHEKEKQAVIFLTPLTGAAQQEVALKLGFHKTETITTLRVQGADEPGLAYLITRAIAAMGISLYGISATVLAGEFSMLLTFSSPADADAVMQRLSKAL